MPVLLFPRRIQSGAVTVVIGLAEETDIAFAIGRLKTRSLGLAGETGSAFAIGRRKSRLLGLAEEIDLAFPITSDQVGAAKRPGSFRQRLGRGFLMPRGR